MARLDELTLLERLALQLSFEAPERRNKYAGEARVSWDLIEELRGELERRGFNWRAGCRETKRLEAENRRAWREARYSKERQYQQNKAEGK